MKKERIDEGTGAQTSHSPDAGDLVKGIKYGEPSGEIVKPRGQKKGRKGISRESTHQEKTQQGDEERPNHCKIRRL